MDEILCNLLDPNVERYFGNLTTTSANVLSYNFRNQEEDSLTVDSGIHNNSDIRNITLKQSHLDPWEFHDWNKSVFIPCLCVFGIVGNLLNIVILGKRTKEGVDTMEKGALIGMMSLAICDLLFCLVTVSGSGLPAAKMIYHRRDFAFYYTLYSNYLQNLLIKVSTWFTVILAVGRYFVVCHPIIARHHLRSKHTVISSCFFLVIWVCLNIPLCYLWTTKKIICSTMTVYLLTPGIFTENKEFKIAFTYVWFIFGFVVPVFILAYCNACLICALQESRQIQNPNNFGTASVSRARPSAISLSNCPTTNSRYLSANRGVTSQNLRKSNQRRLTYTLIAIIIMFFISIFPSEVVQFYGEMNTPEFNGPYRVILNFNNLLQAINFSGNFALYCIVNAYFRRTIMYWLVHIKNYCSGNNKEINISMKESRKFSRFSVTTKHSIVSIESSKAEQI